MIVLHNEIIETFRELSLIGTSGTAWYNVVHGGRHRIGTGGVRRVKILWSWWFYPFLMCECVNVCVKESVHDSCFLMKLFYMVVFRIPFYTF